ncbi:glycerol kinase [Vibrio cholerae]|nr:glycerol kinase [Vibrio cholerae]
MSMVVRRRYKGWKRAVKCAQAWAVLHNEEE